MTDTQAAQQQGSPAGERYASIRKLKLDRPEPRILRITMERGKINALDYDMHRELAEIWRIIDNDPETNAVILTGAGRAFSAGGDFDMEKQIIEDWEMRLLSWKDAKDLVYNCINCSKPIIAAINGPAAGGGLVSAMLSDVSIAARSAKIVDGHTRLGVAAGDHAAIIWPLLCGMAKAKYYLLTCRPISGEEAERIGLVSMCVDDDKLQDTAMEIARELAAGAPTAIRWTKYLLNNWLRAAGPIFDTSLALEMMSFSGPEVKEGLQAHIEKRQPKFDPDSPI
jgi:enoyl-CoA hydratase